jgi:hypothetical protein
MKSVKVKRPKEAGCSCSSESNSNCCSQKPTPSQQYILSSESTSIGEIPKVLTTLSFKDVLGSWKARWGINRMNYKVNPGIYYVGNPDSKAPVLVTANYKMSFDSLRKELTGVDAFILVLDTKGINVWCAAGKGTFGTKELINRIRKVNLSAIVTHKNVILPQLGAPGIIAHEVQKQTGFKAFYGPVKASDLKAFLSNNMVADKKMREVKFTFTDRLVLTPIELITAFKSLIIVFGVLFILNTAGFGHYALLDLCAFLGAIIIGSIITPLLLPWIPGRAFAFKGFLLGLLWVALILYINNMPDISSFSFLKDIAYIFILPCISAFISMNFTGCSTYTSLSGVKYEMKIAVPLMIISTGLGIILILIDSFIKIFS